MRHLKGDSSKMNTSYQYNFRDETGILAFTSGAGGGHERAVAAVQSIAKAQNPNATFKKVDSLSKIMPTFLSNHFAREWDEAKAKGDVKKQIKIVEGKILGVSRRLIADTVFGIPIFVITFIRLLLNRKITRIVDTQPIGTKAIIRAARLTSFLFGRNIKVTKVMTDLPSLEAVHFSESAKRLSKADKGVYELVSTQPLAKKTSESDEQFIERQEKWWQKHFGLSLKNGEVKYGPFPLRPAFLNSNPNDPMPLQLQVKINNNDEFAKISGCIRSELKTEKVKRPFSGTKEIIKLDIPKDATVGMITIGSQATIKPTKEYVQNFIRMVKTFGEAKKEYVLFVACGDHSDGENTLFKQVYNIVKTTEDLPDNLTIVPMGFQDDDEIAALMKRADFGIYGAGGLTTMEVNAVSKGKVFIHSGIINHGSVSSYDKLMEGFALWEVGNANHQLKNKAATITTTGKSFYTTLLHEQIFSTNFCRGSREECARIKKIYEKNKSLIEEQRTKV